MAHGGKGHFGFSVTLGFDRNRKGKGAGVFEVLDLFRSVVRAETRGPFCYEKDLRSRPFKEAVFLGLEPASARGWGWKKREKTLSFVA